MTGKGKHSEIDPSDFSVHDEKDVAYAILRQKASPNKLIVDDATNDDNSVMTINPKTMKELKLFKGDTILIKGKMRKETVLICLSDDSVEENKVRINKVARNNLRVRLGDIVAIHPCQDIKYGQRVHLLPIDDTVEGVTGNLFDVYLKPYFLEAYRPIMKGDLLLIRGGMRAVEFKVVECDPSPYCIVAQDTIIHCEGDPIKREDEEQNSNAVGYDDVGGCRKQMAQIRELVELPLRHPQLFKSIGIKPPRGILLYGPPGTGKTLMARQIGKMLNAREPIIVNGPEILNKYVGQSEENVRKLFAEAEKEYKARGDESSLHIIIFDELDAICKQRGGRNDGTGVGDSVVNQLLAKMDGVEQLNNILIIGMTNRKDMIDEALLRPGRLEVHMEISLPDQHGRVQILNIHTAKMRENHLLAPDVDIEELASLTKNFSGAEIAGFVRSASTFAFSRHIKGGTTATVNDDVENLKICQSDFLHALDEVHPSFGVSDTELQLCVQNGIIPFSDDIDRILKDGNLFVEQVKNSNHTPLVSVLLHGASGCGKTALAATIAMNSDYPFIKLITPENMVGYSEMTKMNEINKIFNDSYKSPLSVIVIDSLERLLDWVPIGPRFSNTVLQTLLVLLKKQPPKGHKLLIISTTSQKSILQEMDMLDSFNAEIYVPSIKSLSSIDIVLKEIDLFSDSERAYVMENIRHEIKSNYVSIGIKKLLMIAEMARQDDDKVSKFVSTLLMEPSMMAKDRY